MLQSVCTRIICFTIKRCKCTTVLHTTPQGSNKLFVVHYSVRKNVANSLTERQMSKPQLLLLLDVLKMLLSPPQDTNFSLISTARVKLQSFSFTLLHAGRETDPRAETMAAVAPRYPAEVAWAANSTFSKSTPTRKSLRATFARRP